MPERFRFFFRMFFRKICPESMNVAIQKYTIVLEQKYIFSVIFAAMDDVVG